MAKHDMDCVAHTHTPAGMAVSAMECGLLPLAQTSMRFLHIAYHDFEGIADNVDERDVVRTPATHEAMILRNYGLWSSVSHRSRQPSMCCSARARLPGAGHGVVLHTKLIYPPKHLEDTYERTAEARPRRPYRRPRLAGAIAQACR
jgi:hypothetical protein